MHYIRIAKRRFLAALLVILLFFPPLTDEANITREAVCKVCYCVSVANISTIMGCEKRDLGYVPTNFIPFATSLSLSSNRIEKLEEDVFVNLSKLIYLDLSKNRLTSLPVNLFNAKNKPHKVVSLLLHRNQLVYLPANVFRGLPELTVLSLFHNKIQALEDDCFAGIGYGAIYLFGNKLSALSNSSFNNENISEIHVYGNDITRIDKPALVGVNENATIFIDCQRVQDLRRPNGDIKCVTPEFVPNITMPSNMRAILKEEGFICGDQTCSPCPRGTFGREGECFPCPRGGFYSDEIGVMSNKDSGMVCKQCSVGTYVKNGEGKSIGDCMVCPDGTNKQINAGYRACSCLDNYAREDRFGPCRICLEEGVNCSGKGYKSIKAGYYWDWEFSGANLTKYKKFVESLNREIGNLDLHAKYDGDIPRPFKCPRLKSCSISVNDVEIFCSEGYKGWLCSKCDEKFYPVMNNCLPCPNSEWIFIEVALICCFCVILYAIALRLYKLKRSCTKRRERFFLDMLISRGKIALGFYQVVGEFFASVHDVNWAKALKVFGEFVSLIELNIFRMIIRPKCFDEKLQLNPKIEFVIGMTFPCTLICLSFLVYCIMKARYKWKTRVSNDSDSQNGYQQKLKSNLLTCVIVLLFVTYPPICTTIFQIYPRACKTFCLDTKNSTCRTLLRSDYDIPCEELKTYHVFVYISTALYVVGFPVALFLLLRNKAKLILRHGSCHSLSAMNGQTEGDLQIFEDESSSKRANPIWMDFLCENYKPQYWYWEIVELTRKVTQTVLITLLGWEDKLTVLLTIGISVMYLTLHARYMPMKCTFEQRLQMFSLTAILANVLVAAMDVPDVYGDEMSVAVVILNILVIVIVAAEVFLGLFIRLRHVAFHKLIFKFGMSLKSGILNIVRKVCGGRNYESM